MNATRLQQLIDIGGHQQGGWAIAFFVKLATHLARLEIELDGVRPVQSRFVHETGGRIDGARGADGDKEIALGQRTIDAIQPERHFAKPDHMGAHRLGELAAGAELVLMEISAPLDHLTGLGAAGLEQLAVHMDKVLAASALVQIVDVLGDQGDRAGQQSLEAGQRIVGRIRMDLGLLQLFAAGVVKAQHQFGIPGIPLGGRHILDLVLFPQTIAGTKSLDAGFGRDPRAGQDHDMFI